MASEHSSIAGWRGGILSGKEADIRQKCRRENKKEKNKPAT